jgi:hypothetical protein
VNERNVNERDVNERDVNERNVNEWNNTEELDEENDELNEEERINRLNDDKELEKKSVERRKCDWASRWEIRKTRRWERTKRAKRRSEIHETRRCERSWERTRERAQKKRKSNENTHFQTFDYENKMQIQCECLSSYDQWDIVFLMQNENSEYRRQRVFSLKFFRFLDTFISFSASESQTDESRCLVWD